MWNPNKLRTDRVALSSMEPAIAKRQLEGWTVLAVLPSRYSPSDKEKGAMLLDEVVLVLEKKH